MGASPDADERLVGPPHDPGDVMGRAARRLQEEHGDVEATLQAITRTAIKVVPHVEECSISYVISRPKLEPRAWSGDLPRKVDLLQERVEQGPCLNAVWEEPVVRVDDVASDDRWPRFAREG